MNYYVKLTQKSFEELKAAIGIDVQEINMCKGLLKVATADDVRKVADKFEIENVNRKPYEEAMAVAEKEPEAAKPVKEFSLKERKEIIGQAVGIGSIVMLDLEEGVEHAVVIDVKGDRYIAARILLKKTAKQTANSIPLRKGIDVIYRNLTYKQIVTVVNEVAYDLEASDFKKDSGGAIIGRVVNEEILDTIMGWNEENDEEDSGIEPASFEQYVKPYKNVEDIIQNLWLHEYDLVADLVRECAKNNSRNMKVLLPAMQKNLHDYTQAQIKENLDSQLKDWAEAFLMEMQECTIPYFLKVIQEQLNGK